MTLLWGARACRVLAIAFCDRELFQVRLARMDEPGVKPKFVAAECGDQHAASVRSPDRMTTPNGVKCLARCERQRKFRHGYASN
jgi:hypothetical protein